MTRIVRVANDAYVATGDDEEGQKGELRVLAGQSVSFGGALARRNGGRKGASGWVGAGGGCAAVLSRLIQV